MAKRKPVISRPRHLFFTVKIDMGRYPCEGSIFAIHEQVDDIIGKRVLLVTCKLSKKMERVEYICEDEIWVV